MKTIATAAVFIMLTAPVWADEAGSKHANEPANTSEPIVLSEAEMDKVTAGDNVGVLLRGTNREEVERGTSTSVDNSLSMVFQSYSLYPNSQ